MDIRNQVNDIFKQIKAKPAEIRNKEDENLKDASLIHSLETEASENNKYHKKEDETSDSQIKAEQAKIENEARINYGLNEEIKLTAPTINIISENVFFERACLVGDHGATNQEGEEIKVSSGSIKVVTESESEEGSEGSITEFYF